MKYFVFICIFLSGCVAPPINITQDGRQESRQHHERNDRLIIVVIGGGESIGSPVPPTVSEAEAEPISTPKASVKEPRSSDKSSRSVAVKTRCPQFKLPLYGNTPEIPPIDSNRSGDYKYIAELLLDHVESLMQYTADVKRRNVEAYDRYVDACDLKVD